ncbi:acylamide amidohydrolase [Micractinium conductrix]|uniref:Acylamide amidohydrolase n=1 Tax=Micractinium conductrix TaxID=554055 RepID=A0A2P6VAV5_9CHLO|nr:acylamide amidohydrolase [Micractinium conductrix]|eukprot:PSC71181.1 acylamide amidohydrolase [Micractinium conductrix]
MIEGLKRGYPGECLDLVIFPEYSTQGFHPHKWGELTTTLDGPEVQIFKQACKDNGVYGIFSLTGEEHPEGLNPYNTLVMVSDEGEINLVYRKMFPWCPLEPWTAGHETAVAVGPKGLIVGATICYDLNLPEIMRDTVMKGAELVVRIQGYMYPAKAQQIQVANVRAWENNCYVAVSNMAGRDLVYSYFGHSNIISYDGLTLAECETTPDEATYAELSISAVRNARRNWSSENHLYNIVHRGYTSEAGGHAPCPFEFYKNWVNHPDKARATSEALTRDTDSPLKCSYEDVPVMKPSRLAEETLHAPRAETTGRTGLGKDAGKHGMGASVAWRKHGMYDDDISTEEAGE